MMKSEELRATNKPEYTKLYKQVEAMLNNLATTKSQIKNIEVDLALLEDDFDVICTIVYSEATGPEEDDFESEEANREMRRTKLRQEMKLKQSEVAKVENALATLPKKEYELIEWRYFKKYNNRQTAIKLDLTEEYCSNLKTKIINKLIEIIFLIDI